MIACGSRAEFTAISFSKAFRPLHAQQHACCWIVSYFSSRNEKKKRKISIARIRRTTRAQFTPFRLMTFRKRYFYQINCFCSSCCCRTSAFIPRASVSPWNWTPVSWGSRDTVLHESNNKGCRRNFENIWWGLCARLCTSACDGHPNHSAGAMSASSGERVCISYSEVCFALSTITISLYCGSENLNDMISNTMRTGWARAPAGAPSREVMVSLSVPHSNWT